MPLSTQQQKAQHRALVRQQRRQYDRLRREYSFRAWIEKQNRELDREWDERVKAEDVGIIKE